MRRLTVATVILSVFLVSSVGLVAAEEYVVRLPESEDVDEPEKLKRHAVDTQESVVDSVESEGGEVVRSFWITNALLVRGDEKLRDSLEDRNGVRVHDNYAFGAPAQVRSSESGAEVSAAEAVNATGVWEELGVRGDGARVAVLDTGVAVNHPDIELRTTGDNDSSYPGGWSEFKSSGERVNSTPYDSASHGTHVSGTVAGGNGSGTAVGVAPRSELMHAKVFDDKNASFAAVVAGMEWSVENDADVISMSIGTDCSGEPLYEDSMLAPVRNAAKAGSFVVSAAGNGGDGCSSSPGNIHDVLSVGAVDGDGDVPSFSGGERINVSKAWGEDAPSDWPTEYVVPNVTALGVGVYSTVPGGGYGRMDGTSTAVPHVAGVAALVESATRRDMTPGELRDVIASGARKSDDGLDTRHGVGTVDAYAAVAKAREEVDIQESLSEGVSVPDTTDGNGTEGGDSGEEPEEDGVPPTPGFGVVAFLAAVLLRKVTCHSGDTG